MSEDVSSKIKNMALVCAVLVVGIHVKWPHDTAFSLGWFGYHFIKEGIACIAVPFFFTVSGFFLGRHFGEDGWWRRAVFKRVLSLVVPFYIWCLVAVLITVPLSMIADLLAHRPFGTSVISSFPGINAILAFDLSLEPVLIPLWYLRSLFLFVLTSFAIEILVCRLSVAWLGISFLFVVTFAFVSSPYWASILDHGYSVWGLFYFSMGAYLAQRNFKAYSSAVAISCAVIGIVLMLVRVFFASRCILAWDLCKVFMIPALLYATWHYMPSRKLPDFLASCPFPIYLMHGIVLSLLCFAWNRVGLDSLETVRALAMYVFGILVPMLVYAFLKRRFPRLSAIAFGGR